MFQLGSGFMAMGYVTLALHLLLQASLLQINTAILNFTQKPTPQVVELGQNATFHCTGEGSSGELAWIVTNSQRDYALRIAYNSNSTEFLELYKIFIVGNASLIQKNPHKVRRYNSILTFLETREFNNTDVVCVLDYLIGNMESEAVQLTVIGEPDIPSNLSAEINDIGGTGSLVVKWGVPFSHKDHAITQYKLNATNNRNKNSVIKDIQPPTSTNRYLNTTLQFPNGTQVCDVLSIVVTAFNDIGESDPAIINTLVYKLSDRILSVSYHHNEELLTIHVKFEGLCPNEEVQYTVELHNLDKAILNKMSSSEEDLSMVVKLNTHYSFIVIATTDFQSISSDSYNFSTRPTDYSTAAADTIVRSNGRDQIMTLGPAAGSIALLILVISSIIVVLCALHYCKKNSGVRSSVGRITNLPHLNPNPIYDGPLYDTAIEPCRKLQPLPAFPPNSPNGYSESPLYSKIEVKGDNWNTSIATYDKLSASDDCYIQMQCDRKK